MKFQYPDNKPLKKNFVLEGLHFLQANIRMLFTMQLKAYIREFELLKPYLVTIPAIVLLSYLFYNLSTPDMVIMLGKEDSLFEWLTALFYLVAAILLVCTYKKNRNIFLLLLAIVLFFGAGEEISWGQRIFNFATPEELKKVNVQGEFTIHNIEMFTNQKLDGHTGAGFERVLEMDFLFKLFTLLFGVALPIVVYHNKWMAAFVQKLKVPVPPLTLGIFFFISWIFLRLSVGHIALRPNMVEYWKIRMAGPEISEFIGSYILAIIALYFYKRRTANIMGKDIKQLLDA
jgi:hypothetical protein